MRRLKDQRGQHRRDKGEGNPGRDAPREPMLAVRCCESAWAARSEDRHRGPKQRAKPARRLPPWLRQWRASDTKVSGFPHLRAPIVGPGSRRPLLEFDPLPKRQMIGPGSLSKYSAGRVDRLSLKQPHEEDSK